MAFRPTFRQRRLESLGRRARAGLDRLRGRFAKAQRAWRVEVNGVPLKRLRLPDAGTAAALEARLARLADTGVLPAPVLRHQNELWVEFVEGRPLERAGPEVAAELAECLAALYRVDPRRVPAAQLAPERAMLRHLRQLVRLGAIPAHQESRLGERIDALRPDALWIGFDYTDLRRKNCIREPGGRIRIVDVESVAAAELLGTGLARGLGGWLAPWREEMLGALVRAGAPDLREQMPFVELRQRLAWTLRSVLLGKWELVDPRRFDPFT